MIARREAEVNMNVASSEGPGNGRLIAGRYRLVRRLDDLGSASVYEAEQVAVGRRVALKLLEGEITDAEWRRFVGAARLAARVVHRNVVAVYDVDQDVGGVGFVAMELCDGMDLAKLVAERGPLAAEQVIELGQGILAGLEAAHQQEVLHGALCPKYVLVPAWGRLEDDVKVLGFGLGVLDRGDEQVRWYAAPEVARGAPIEVSSDLFSVAAVLLYALVGAEIGQFASAGDLDEKSLRFLLGRTADTEAWVAFLATALAQEPAQRYVSAKQMASAMARLRVGSFEGTAGVTVLGEAFGDYVILRSLGEGGMGRVRLARPSGRSDARVVVLKTIRPDFATDERFRAAFLAEAQITRRMEHPNIARVIEVGEVGTELYMAMEYVAGKSLRQLLDRAGQDGFMVPLDVALYIVGELADALSYAHRLKVAGREGFAHGDVSSANVLLSYEGAVKLIDFGVMGLARLDEGRPVLGTRSYTAPEVAAGQTPTPAADIYGLGALTAELLSGQPTLEALMARKDLPDEIFALVRRAMARNPAVRYPTASDFGNEIRRILANLNPVVGREGLALFVRELFPGEYEADLQASGGLATAPPRRPDGRGLDGGPLWADETLQVALGSEEESPTEAEEETGGDGGRAGQLPWLVVGVLGLVCGLLGLGVGLWLARC